MPNCLEMVLVPGSSERSESSIVAMILDDLVAQAMDDDW